MKYYGDIDLNRNKLIGLVLPMEVEFPANPVPGMLCFKNKRLYACSELDDGLPVWVQMTNEIDVFIFSLPSPMATWTIEHNLHASAVAVQVYDLNGILIMPDSVNTSSPDQTIITFGGPQAGRAIVIAGDDVAENSLF